MPIIISTVIALIAAGLFSGLATGYASSGDIAFHLNIPAAIACFLTALIAMISMLLLSRDRAPTGSRAVESQTGEQQGTVKWFNPKKGFGFIVCSNGEEVFVHYRNIEGSGRKILKEGEPVTFVIIEGPKGPQAENVRQMR